MPGPPLVEPHEPMKNDGRDNANNELIVYQGMKIITSKNHCYRADQNLGKGASGSVFKVTRLTPDDFKEIGTFALKISQSDFQSVHRLEYECKVLEFVC